LTISEERKKRVIDLYYNQGKTTREISKEARISPRDIGIILNKVFEGKKTEASQEQQDNDKAEQYQEQEQTTAISPRPGLQTLF
jgi:transposase